MRRWMFVVGSLALALWPAHGNAFCGFYVGGTTDLKNDATQVVLMRQGRHTVMSIQNNYEGPPEDFALVVPVPTVLSEADVRTLPRELFDRVDQLASPRLVEYWEQDPCPQPVSGANHGYAGIGMDSLGTLGTGRGAGYGLGAGSIARPAVRVEAQFAVDEYDIAILSADDSSGLERWLRSHGYTIPRGAAAALRPYVEAGTKFFVARVDASRLTFEGRRAQLSPLRVHYESDTFSLPIRLGMLNARGAQDLIVHVLAPQRFEVANRPNVTIPTNLRVSDDVRSRFSTFYSALFDATVRENPGAVVTEYAWSPSSCDPCPGPTLTPSDVSTLGGDVAHGMDRVYPAPPALEIAGRVVSFAVPVAEDERTQTQVERALRRRVALFDSCVTGNVRSSGFGATRGNLVGHIGFLLMPGLPPTVELTGEVPNDVASCVRNAARRVMSEEVEVDAPQLATARINAGWRIVRVRSQLGLTLSRMHYRYRRSDAPDDLVFRPADALVGGRGTPDANGAMAADVAQPGARMNMFQGRYAILHEWEGAISCAYPQRGRWGGQLGGGASVTAASDLGDVRERRFSLRRAILTPVPSLNLERDRPRRSEARPSIDRVPVLTADSPGFRVARGSMMACNASAVPSSGGVAWLALGLALLCLRRRPRR